MVRQACLGRLRAKVATLTRRGFGLSSCVIRCKPASESDAIRPPIPTEVGHPFRLKPATLLIPA